jgi:hypothetical protein
MEDVPRSSRTRDRRITSAVPGGTQSSVGANYTRHSAVPGYSQPRLSALNLPHTKKCRNSRPTA